MRKMLTVTTVLAVGDGSIAQLLLGLDNVFHLLVLDRSQFSLCGLARLVGNLSVQQVVGTEQ